MPVTDEKFAIISDIHGNLEALTAVLQEIDRAEVSRIVCLGDIVGYGADFDICLDIVAERSQVVLCGNHDEAVLTGPVDFNPVARDVINYTRTEMKPSLISSSRKRFRWNFLKSLNKSYKEGIFNFYHGSPRDPVKEYVMRTDVVFAPEKLRDIFTKFDRVCFIGHTHQPGVIVDESSFHFHEPKRLNNRYEIGDRKAVINVGSVGQPRDNDNRASFVIVENYVIHFLRIPYDYESAMQKIENNPSIHNNCAARLAIGK
ncbi:MAG: metallophosphoesterase family protein [Planctomycetota bacterium]|jgi:predicted phosphodiesterase